MSSTTNPAELSSNSELPSNNNTADQDVLSASEEMSDRGEVVEGLELVPVPLASAWLACDGANEYVQLCNGMCNNYTNIDCGLPLLSKEFGNPLADPFKHCDCDDDEDHTCWLTSEFCGTRGQQGPCRRKLVYALQDAIYAFENGMLHMYRDSTLYGRNSQAGRLTPGLYKVATKRLSSLTHGVERLQEFHKQSTNTSPDELKPSSSASDGDTRDDVSHDDGSDNKNSDDSNKDLADLERRLLACKADLLKPLERVPNTKESIIKASEDLKLAVRTYDNAGKGPRSAVREYYKDCVLQVADAMPSLEHYADHPICQGLEYTLEKIDDGYREARHGLYQFSNSAELSDGLEKILWSIWDETRRHFEGDMVLVERPRDLRRDPDPDSSCSEDSELDSQVDSDEDPEYV